MSNDDNYQRFLNVVSSTISQGTMAINMVKTSSWRPINGTWIGLWKKRTKNSSPICCSKIGCLNRLSSIRNTLVDIVQFDVDDVLTRDFNEDAIHGAHVLLSNKEYTPFGYIIPLCSACNNKNNIEPFEICDVFAVEISILDVQVVSKSSNPEAIANKLLMDKGISKENLTKKSLLLRGFKILFEKRNKEYISVSRVRSGHNSVLMSLNSSDDFFDSNGFLTDEELVAYCNMRLIDSNGKASYPVENREEVRCFINANYSYVKPRMKIDD